MGKPDVSLLTHWSSPVTQLQPDWVLELVPYYEQLVLLAFPYTQDPIGLRDWDTAKGILDRPQEPESVEEANKRWREFVASVWWLMEKSRIRFNQQMAARRR